MPMLVEYRPICDRCQGSLSEELHAVNSPKDSLPVPSQKHEFYGYWLCTDCADVIRTAINEAFAHRRADRR